jgi:hypothetical protein
VLAGFIAASTWYLDAAKFLSRWALDASKIKILSFLSIFFWFFVSDQYFGESC